MGRAAGRGRRVMGAALAGLLGVVLVGCGASGGTGGGQAQSSGTGGGAAATSSSTAAGGAPAKPQGPYVSMTFGDNPTGSGLTQEESGGSAGDSEFHSDTIGGQPAFVFDPNTAASQNALSYLYFQVDPSSAVLQGSPATLYLSVTYYDAPAGGQLFAEYDSTDASQPVNGAYKATASKIATAGQKAWKSVTWKLVDVNLQQGENGNSDFRLDGSSGVAVGGVVLSVNAPPGSKPQ